MAFIFKTFAVNLYLNFPKHWVAFNCILPFYMIFMFYIFSLQNYSLIQPLIILQILENNRMCTFFVICIFLKGNKNGTCKNRSCTRKMSCSDDYIIRYIIFLPSGIEAF